MLYTGDRDDEDIYTTLVNGLVGFSREFGRSKCCIGLSGGIDSAVVATLATKALGRGNVMAFLMPGDFSTMSSIQDAVDLCSNLGIEFKVIQISALYRRFIKELTPVLGKESTWGIAQEHIQARIRTTLLMAYANKANAFMLNTTNKTDLLTGQGVLTGDLSGQLMVIGDLYKSDVYNLADHINVQEKLIPRSIIAKEPSSEFRHGQTDTDSFPEFKRLDMMLYFLHDMNMEKNIPFVNAMKAMGIDDGEMSQIRALMVQSEHKLVQAPPVLNVSEHPAVDSSKWYFRSVGKVEPVQGAGTENGIENWKLT